MTSVFDTTVRPLDEGAPTPDPVRVPVPVPTSGHWQHSIRKTVWTLNVGPGPGKRYAPEVCSLTYPLLEGYARKIGADFRIIQERKFPEWPVVYEKLQIHELAKGGRYCNRCNAKLWIRGPESNGYFRENGVGCGCGGEFIEYPPSEWNIYIDSDALVNPEMFDITEHLGKDTVAHNGKDMAGVRWSYDQYFRRDGRHIGSCNWFTIASDWCLDLWRPLDDLAPEEAFRNIHITVGEHNSGECRTEHLIDDYTLSRNIARFGLKFKTITDICGELGWKNESGKGFSPHLYHLYTIPEREKISRMLAVLSTPNGQIIMDPRNPEGRPGGPGPIGVGWGLMSPEEANERRKEWGVR